MSIAGLVLFVLAVASAPQSTVVSPDVVAAQHAGHAGTAPSAFVEMVREATERFRDIRNVPPDTVRPWAASADRRKGRWESIS